MLRFLYFMIFPILLAYPNGLLANTYLNYTYIVLVFLCFLIFEIGNKFRFTILNRFFFFLFLIVLIANVWSIHLNNEIGFFNYTASTLRYLSYFFISHILVNTTKTEKQFRFWVNSFFFGFSMSLLIVLLDALRIPWIETTFQLFSFEETKIPEIYFRAYGAYLSPISASVFILNSFLLTISMLLTKVTANKKEVIILWSLSIISIIAIILTASRTSLVALFAAIIIIILFSKSRFKFIFITLTLIIIIYKTGLLNHYFENIILRSINETSYGQSALEGSGRIETAVNSIRLYFGERTFYFGVGPSEYSFGDKVFSLAHNGFLSLLFCYGFAGVILFCIALISLFKSIYIKRSRINNFKYNKFIKLYFSLFFLINIITFISSDGPVTHFWLIYLLFFMFFVDNYIKAKEFTSKLANFSTIK